MNDLSESLDLTPLEKSLSLLEQSLAYLHSDLAASDEGLRAQFRSACIQAFEFTYEVGMKMLRRQLELIVINPSELREMAFMDLIRSAADAGLLNEVSRFRLYLEKRNITSHTYDEGRAEEVLSILPDFKRDLEFLLAELRRRNGA